ncbi:MAG: cytochrome P450 [Leptolyngbyaceae cyanobacterium CRU_2_3]|nr:cytochrome P450 [Leptolyngbyaceae cyanobacterium CRU_2_3]
MKPSIAPHKLSFPQLLQWGRHPSDFLDALTDRYGDIFSVQFPGDKPVIIVSDPQGIEELLTAPLGTFSSGQGNEMFRPVMGDYSMLLLDGKPHQRQRKLTMAPFHGERMRLYGSRIGELTEQMMQPWQVGTTVDLPACMKDITLNALLDIVFGLTAGRYAEQLRQKLLDLIGLVTSPLIALHLFLPSLQKDWGLWSPWGRFRRLQREVDQLLYKEIAHRRASPEIERTDILSMLMAARDEEGEPMSNEELRDGLITLLTGGFDTTSTALVWTLYWIHQTPNVRKRLMEELDSISDPSDMRAIAKLPYLSATCQEALRISPPIVLTFIRVAQVPFQLMGHQLPVGSRIWGDMYSVHRRPDLYPHADQFRPERFLERQYSPHEFLPFGGGDRLCIGNAFALYLMKLVIFTILSRYELALDDPRPVRAIRRGPGLEPSRLVQMKIVGYHYRSSCVATGEYVESEIPVRLN